MLIERRLRMAFKHFFFIFRTKMIEDKNRHENGFPLRTWHMDFVCVFASNERGRSPKRLPLIPAECQQKYVWNFRMKIKVKAEKKYPHDRVPCHAWYRHLCCVRYLFFSSFFFVIFWFAVGEIITTTHSTKLSPRHKPAEIKRKFRNLTKYSWHHQLHPISKRRTKF